MATLQFIRLGNDNLSVEEYVQKKSEQLSGETGKLVTASKVREYLELCQTGQDFPDDTPAWEYENLESVCKDVETFVEETAIVAHEVASQGFSELEMVEAAREITLQNAWEKLSEKFEFGKDFTELTPKAQVSNVDYAQAFAFGVHMSHGGKWIMAKALIRMEEMGYENVIIQIAGEMKLHESTIYNLVRTERRIPKGSLCRGLLPPSVVQEILLPKYSDDEAENVKIREDLLKQAEKEGWNSSEVRSHVDMIRGVEKKPKKKTERFLVFNKSTREFFTTTEEPEFSEETVVVETNRMVFQIKNGSSIGWLEVPVK